MDIKDRIKKTRKNAGLTQADFGKRIGITDASVSRIEKGENNPSEQTLMLICNEFGVNYLWLKTGEGTMFKTEANDLDKIIDGLMVGEKETAKAVFKALAALGGEEWELFRKFILNAAREIEQSEHTKE